MKRRIISVICILALCLTSITPAFAATQSDLPRDDNSTKGIVRVNPLYKEFVSEEEIAHFGGEVTTTYYSPMARSVDFNAAEFTDDENEIISQIRTALVNRETEFTVKFCVQLPADADLKENFAAYAEYFIDESMKHTGEPKEGDSLKWAWKIYDTAGSIYSNSLGDCYFEIQYSFVYYTTAAQEAELDTAVTALRTELNLDGLSDYEKVAAIYHYICRNITYDNANLKNESYYLKYTPYAALIHKTSVCQGYALLFYRLCLEYDIDSRLISGIGNGGPHGWNIVRLDDKYYFLDATWDAERLSSAGIYCYFLIGSREFLSDHICDEEFTTKEFLTAYPISETAYGGVKHVWGDARVHIPATTTEDGKFYLPCTECPTTEVTIIPKIESVQLSNTSYTYNGQQKTPTVIIKDSKGNTLTKGVDYELTTPSGRIDAGKYTYTVKFKGNYSGSKSLTMTINKASISGKTATLSYTKASYNGSAKKPTVKISGLTKDTHYTVSYKNNVSVGRPTVTITGKGNYTGTITKRFTIVPKAPSSASAKLYGYDDVKFSWTKATGASGYAVYYKKSTSSSYTLLTRTTGTSVKKANLTDGVKYNFKVVPYYKSGDTRYASTSYKTASVYTLKKMGTPTAAKSGTKAKISWKKINGATGYHVVQYKKQNGKYVKLAGYYTTGTYKLFTASKGAPRYYQIRAYKTVDGKKIFGPWSAKREYKRK